MRLAIFGGTFDPVHRAHLAVAEEALRRFDLSKVLFIPAARPPHKSGVTRAGYEHRVRMLEIACQGRPEFEVSRLEAGEGKSYSIRTIERVKAALGPGDELFFLIGADAFAEIRTWYRWQEVIRAVQFIVVSRPGHEYSVPEGAEVLGLDTLELWVSSSEIRARIAAGEDPPEVPGAVMEYIRGNGLYRRS